MFLQKSQKKNEENSLEAWKRYLSSNNFEGIANVPFINDPHLMDENGMTVLHLAVSKHYRSPPCTAKLLDGIVHPHVVTCEGLTPLDLARQANAESGEYRAENIY